MDKGEEKNGFNISKKAWVFTQAFLNPNMNEVPLPSSDLTSTCALWDCIIFNVEARPSPIPFRFDVK